MSSGTAGICFTPNWASIKWVTSLDIWWAFFRKRPFLQKKPRNQCAFGNSEVVKKIRKLRNTADKLVFPIVCVWTCIRTHFSPDLIMSHTSFNLFLNSWGEVYIRMKFCLVQRAGTRLVKSHFSSLLFNSSWKCCTERLRAPWIFSSTFSPPSLNRE